VTISTTPVPARTDDAEAAPARRFGGSRPLAVLLLTAPVLLSAAVLAHPDDTHGVGATLAAIRGADGLRWALIHLLEPAGWALLGLALLLALPRMAGALGRGRGLLTTAAVACAIGFPAVSLIVYGHGEAFRAMAGTDVAAETYGPLFEQFESGMPLAALPSLLGRVGLLLAAAGLLRARTVPLWAALLLILPALAMGALGGMPLAVGLPMLFGSLLAALVPCALRVARTGGRALGGA